MSLVQAMPADIPTAIPRGDARKDECGFLNISLAKLDAMDSADLDLLPYGVVGLTATGETALYNRAECANAGLPAASVLGRPFFLTTGVCMNNFLVAQRFEDEDELDVTLDYVLTFRMRPTPVKLRLLKGAAARHNFILLQR